MKKLLLFTGILAVGLFLLASPGRAQVIRACQVKNPPAHCETMWAAIARVRLPKQPGVTVKQFPQCGSRFETVDWGRTVADAFLAEVDRTTLENLALDVSGALQEKSLPEVVRHIQGDAAAYIQESFSKVTPKPWSASSQGYDLSLCAPVIAAVPADATVKELRFLAWDENLGEQECTRGRACSIGDSKYCSDARKTSIGGITLYTAIFQNWSAQWAREGRMVVFFELPGGRVPLTQI